MDSKIPKAAKSYHCPRLAQSFVFDKITEEEVLAQIRLLNPNKAASPENIPIKFLKAIATWGNANKTSLKKLQTMQNNIIRIMNFKRLNDRAKICTQYETMNILKVKNIYELEIAKFMHSFFHGLLPENFNNYSKSANTQHSHNTRTVASNDYYLERVNTKSGQLSCPMRR